ncbi:hypothetical protein HYC85_029588 [Camellia sinensis]|uniref:Uncharacterized protein n=1 Tax=Camellia sinensis TaxID=4442 RepID=A0A7J7FZ20_CAMSI|nr:hypothetical protein HYC85_029588 [Camellia sinensis]
MHLICSLLRDTAVSETHFVAERHFRYLCFITKNVTEGWEAILYLAFFITTKLYHHHFISSNKEGFSKAKGAANWSKKQQKLWSSRNRDNLRVLSCSDPKMNRTGAHPPGAFGDVHTKFKCIKTDPLGPIFWKTFTQKLAKRLTGHGLCHVGNITLGSRLPLYRLIIFSLLVVRCERVEFNGEYIHSAVIISVLHPQPAAASASYVPTAAIPVPSATANIANVQENQDNLTEPILAQASKAPVYHTEAPFEFRVNPTALKVNKLEKLVKRAQGVNFVLDIENGYSDSAVTLLDRFKMPHIDRFDGSRDSMKEVPKMDCFARYRVVT